MTISNPNQRPSPSQTTLRDTVVGVFYNREKAEAAFEDLRSAGFANEDIGVLSRTDNSSWTDYGPTNTAKDPGTAAADGVATGALAGAGIGGLWALGIAAGALPAIGPVIAGGILASIVSSAVAGAAAGGVVGGLIGLGISEDDARYYEREVISGRIVLTVRAGSRHREAASILRAHGAYNIEDSAIPVNDI
jgi:hypothetical protein